ncbi:MAG: hypothetical protein NW215_15670 [Hyphomicrobiales bacterium]|nr:hypothetical protein [Hyphomicrobiales bacterium]
MRYMSPVWLGLNTRLKRKLLNAKSYKQFTTAFDEILKAENLEKHLSPLSSDLASDYKQAIQYYDVGFQTERMILAEEATRFIREVRERLNDEQRKETIISLLIDHSGSMKGLRMISALIAVECAVQALEECSISTEILGYTTVNWKGGQSRRAWRWAGRPSNPGRLCDLRHIIYAEAGDQPRLPWHLRLALRPDILRENVDGEALEWASSRILNSRFQQKIVCIISDGAPVDDSTLTENGGNYLYEHLSAVRKKLKSDNIKLGTLLLGDLNVPEPEILEKASEPISAGLGLLKLIRRIIFNTHEPKSISGAAPSPNSA